MSSSLNNSLLTWRNECNWQVWRYNSEKVNEFRNLAFRVPAITLQSETKHVVVGVGVLGVESAGRVERGSGRRSEGCQNSLRARFAFSHFCNPLYTNFTLSTPQIFFIAHNYIFKQ